MNNFEIEIKCNKDDDFNLQRNVEYSCGCRFTISEDDIYCVDSLNYFDEEVKEYYTICPICGHINKLNERIIPNDVKNRVDFKNKVEPFLYKKNNLRSELIYLDRISPPYVLKRIK